MSLQKDPFHRRSFLRMTTGAAAVSALAVPTFIPRSVLAAPGRPGANDRVAVGCVSAGGRARLLMEQLPEAARLIAIADCNLPQALRFKKEIRFELDKGPMGGAIFVGEHGKLEINRNKFMSNPIDIRDALLKKVDEAEEEIKWSDQTALWQAKWHMQNWIDCLKTRESPASDVEIGHGSIAFCQLNNITRWIDRELAFDPATERFVDADDANAWNDRPRRAGYELPEA